MFGVFAALRFYLVTWLGERVVADVRNAVYANVVRMDPTFFEVTRTGEVLSRLTADTTLVQSISGVGISITLRSALTLLGSLVMLVATSPMLDADDRRADAADRRAADHARAARAAAVARLAGPRGRRERARRRNHQRRADRAGVQSRGRCRRSASARPSSTRSRRRAAQSACTAGSRRSRRRSCSARSRSCCGSARTRCSPATMTFGQLSQFLRVRGLHGHRGRVVERDVESGAARGRRHGAARRARARPSRRSRRRRSRSTLPHPMRGRHPASSACGSAIRRARIARRSTTSR